MNQTPDTALAVPLKHYRVHLRRKGTCLAGRVDVQASDATRAQHVAVQQTIEVSYPHTRAADWLVTSYEERGAV